VQIPWREWSPRAFAQAEAENKPVLLSLITAWSDECAAMDQTTYAHPDVVSLIEDRFVPVRVDADRHPDVNDRYNLGGWPTTAFLTGSGDILSGATYLTAEHMIAMLQQVADLCRDRAAEIAARAREVRHGGVHGREVARAGAAPEVDYSTVITDFRSLLVARFDRLYGGFGAAPKLPHPYALLFGLSLGSRTGDSELSDTIEFTLRRMSGLWDPARGGFHRYADNADWSGAATEKTLEDNAALLHVYVDAAVRGRSEFREQAAAIVRWIRDTMADRANGGFYNASVGDTLDRVMYVDRTAMMVGAFIRAAALFDDIWLRDFALKSLEAVIVPAYVPGDGVGHVTAERPSASVRGLLTDQIHVASALIWAHAATGLIPYAMLATELMQYAIRKMWDDRAEAFRDRVASEDPVIPFELNCNAASILHRLSVLTGDHGHQERARTILRSLSSDARRHDLFGAPYALAVLEVIDGQPPAGLELTKVDWT
jgi:uncharacterized protein